MNQKLSWTLLAAGVALFLFQVGDVISNHSTWSDVFSPAGTGDILRVLGGAGLALFGALGVKLSPPADTPSSNSISATTRARIHRDGPSKLSVVMVAVTIGVGAVALPGCVLTGTAVTLPSPTSAQVQAVRAKAVAIADQTRTALVLADGVLTMADQLEQAHLLSADSLRLVTAAGRKFGTVAQPALVALGSVTSDPSLASTTVAILDALDPFVDALATADNAGLRIAATGIKLATAALKR